MLQSMIRASAQKLEQIFSDDLKYSKEITYEAWQSRGIFERLFDLFSFPIRDQL